MHSNHSIEDRYQPNVRNYHKSPYHSQYSTLPPIPFTDLSAARIHHFPPSRVPTPKTTAHIFASSSHPSHFFCASIFIFSALSGRWRSTSRRSCICEGIWTTRNCTSGRSLTIPRDCGFGHRRFRTACWVDFARRFLSSQLFSNLILLLLLLPLLQPLRLRNAFTQVT